MSCYKKVWDTTALLDMVDARMEGFSKWSLNSSPFNIFIIIIQITVVIII